MGEDKELERHERTLEQIRNANSKEEMPNSTLSRVTKFMATNVYFDNRKISQTEFKPVLDAIIENNSFEIPEVKQVFIEILRKNYPGKTEEEYNAQYEKLARTSNISNYIAEANARNARLEELEKQANLVNRQETLKQIREADELRDLPKVGKGVLNKKIQRATQNDFTGQLPIETVNGISDDFLQGKTEEEIFAKLYELCELAVGGDEEQAKEMLEQIKNGFAMDETIAYTAEEVREKEKRILEIYQLDHEETMQKIREAKRISQLPANLTFSTLAGYLSGNTIIYPKAERVSTTDLKDLTQLLLDGGSFETETVTAELRAIAEKYYPENPEEAYGLLMDKLLALPRTQYLVEEINYSQERQTEFIGRNCSNVNVYFVPNPKTPIEGGRFYNCYINRVENLDLGQILPLNLEEIIPEGMDVDTIEWYVQERYDQTFKKAGGIILNKDETIGNVNIFKPSDGRIGITPEEHSKYKELEELGTQVKELIAQKKANTERFRAAQDAFFRYEEASDKKLAELEAKIDAMLGKDSSEQTNPKNNNGEQR
ncbi:MAG: hypothetical protein IJE68_04575 [Clostridia bacterium]|nr:hypothetical protein [Clostridia bacterium]